MIKNVLHISNFNAGMLEKLAADIPDEKFCEQPAHLPNHPAWVIGHLCTIRFIVNKTLGNAVEYPEAWLLLFGRNSEPTAIRGIYPLKTVLLETFRRLHNAACEAFSKVTPEQLAGPHSIGPLQAFAPTLGDLMVLSLVAHDTLHLGQLTDWRRAHGLPRIM